MTDNLEQYKKSDGIRTKPKGLYVDRSGLVLAAQEGSSKSGSTWDVFGTPI